MLPPDADTVLDLLARQQVPPPTPDRKAETLRAANLAFREKINAPAQRTGWLARLLGRSNPKESHMTIKGLLRGTAITLVALVALSTSFDYLRSTPKGSSNETPGYADKQMADSLAVDARDNGGTAPALLGALSAKPLLNEIINGEDKEAGASVAQVAPLQAPAEADQSLPRNSEEMTRSDSLTAATEATAKSAAQPAAPQQSSQ